MSHGREDRSGFSGYVVFARTCYSRHGVLVLVLRVYRDDDGVHDLISERLWYGMGWYFAVCSGMFAIHSTASFLSSSRRTRGSLHE